MANAKSIVQVTIIDPDIRVRIDGIHVYKKHFGGTGKPTKTKPWALEDYNSTSEIDLENGTYFLEIVPYWRGVDPLPVWFEVKNIGNIPLSVECVVSEGTHRYKRLTVIRNDQSINVPGIYNISYRVGISTLPDLHINYISGITKRSGKIFEQAGFMRVKDLVDQEAVKVARSVGMSSWKLAGLIRKAELACNIRLPAGDFEKISHWSLKRVYDTSVSELVRATDQPEEKIINMMDQLGEVALAIDYKYVRSISLDMIFEY